MTPTARFRNSGRDRLNDLERLGPLHRQIERALAGIERECAGLSRRLDESRARTAGLLGNEDGIFFEREPADEAMLIEAEAQMMAAFHRLEALREQKSMIAGWRTAIDDSDFGRALRDEARPAGWLSRRLRQIRGRMAAIRRLSTFQAG